MIDPNFIDKINAASSIPVPEWDASREEEKEWSDKVKEALDGLFDGVDFTTP